MEPQDFEKIDWEPTISQLRSIAQASETVPELDQLRQRINTGTKRTHQEFITRIAHEANVNLEPIYEEARRRNKIKNEYVVQTMEKVEATISEEATQQLHDFERSRDVYLKDLGHVTKAGQKTAGIQFVPLMWWKNSVHPARCCEVIGSTCGNADLGRYEAIADADLDKCVQFHPYISTWTGDCEDSSWAHIHQEAFFLGIPSAQVFHMTSVQVIPMGIGYALSVLGDPGCMLAANPAYIHSQISFSLSIGQQNSNGVLIATWPARNVPLFSGNGDYAQTVFIPAWSSGWDYFFESEYPLFCYFYLHTKAYGNGSGAKVVINFAKPYAINLVSVLILGEYLS